MASYWAQKRKITIQLGLFILVAALISYGIFLTLHVEPSCTDRTQNQDEVGVDCGGSCPIACEFGIVPVKTLWARSFKLTDGLYAIAAYIDNQNEDRAATNVPFEFNIYNEKGRRIDRASSQTFIMPNGGTVVFVPHISTGGQVVANTNFRLLQKPVLQKTQYQYNIAVSDKKVTHWDTEPRAEAVVTNTGTVPLRYMYFVAIIFDGDDNAIAASRTYHENLQPGESMPIYYTWIKPFELNTGDCIAGAGVCDRQPTRMEVVPVQAIDR